MDGVTIENNATVNGIGPCHGGEEITWMGNIAEVGDPCDASDQEVGAGNLDFSDPSTADFHIASSSPAKDEAVGFTGNPNVDFDNQARPQGTAADVGADEVG